jgi:hypothetical protein
VWGHAVRKRKIGEGEMGWLIGRNGKEKRKKRERPAARDCCWAVRRNGPGYRVKGRMGWVK